MTLGQDLPLHGPQFPHLPCPAEPSMLCAVQSGQCPGSHLKALVDLNGAEVGVSSALPEPETSRSGVWSPGWRAGLAACAQPWTRGRSRCASILGPRTPAGGLGQSMSSCKAEAWPSGGSRDPSSFGGLGSSWLVVTLLPSLPPPSHGHLPCVYPESPLYKDIGPWVRPRIAVGLVSP